MRSLKYLGLRYTIHTLLVEVHGLTCISSHNTLLPLKILGVFIRSTADLSKTLQFGDANISVYSMHFRFKLDLNVNNQIMTACVAPMHGCNTYRCLQLYFDKGSSDIHTGGAKDRAGVRAAVPVGYGEPAVVPTMGDQRLHAPSRIRTAWSG